MYYDLINVMGKFCQFCGIYGINDLEFCLEVIYVVDI